MIGFKYRGVDAVAVTRVWKEHLGRKTRPDKFSDVWCSAHIDIYFSDDYQSGLPPFDTVRATWGVTTDHGNASLRRPINELSPDLRGHQEALVAPGSGTMFEGGVVLR